jgi:hypothetical protein
MIILNMDFVTFIEKDYGMVYAINFNHELVVKAIYFYRPYND